MRGNIFEEQMQILELLSSQKAKICINTVVHRLNLDTLYALPESISQKVVISKWQFFQYMPIGPLGHKNREIYQISEEEFEAFRHSSLWSLSWKAEFKKGSGRKGNYLFVDSDGIAWVPKVSFSGHWDKNQDETNQRRIVGDIRKKEDYPRIKDLVFNPSVLDIFRN
jgi:MoaA/NifB/PqqE/SkfB family radical SAM enzyme